MFIKPESRALRALLWVLAVLLPGGFLLLPFLGADLVRLRMRRQEQVALKEAEAPPSLARESEPPEITETRTRSTHVSATLDVVDSTPPAPRAAA